MLTLVHPARDGQDPPKRRKGRPALSMSLTPEEGRHLRAAIRNIVRTRYGSFVKLAAALGVHASLLSRKRRPTPHLAVAIWRLTGIPLAELLTPTLAAAPAPPPMPSPGGAS